MQKFGHGISSWFDAWGFIFRHRLAHYFLYPLFFILLWTWAASAGIDWLVEQIRSYVFTFFKPLSENSEKDGFWEQIVAFFHDMTGYALRFILWLTFTWFYYKLSKYIILIMMSPVMALLSERTEEILSDRHFPFEWPVFLKDVLRGIVMTVRNFLFEMIILATVTVINLGVGLFAAPLLVIISPLSTVFVFVVGAYFYGFSVLDYNNERARLSISQSAKMMRQNKGAVIAVGGIFSLWLMIPVLGTFLGTIIAPVTCAVAGTLVMNKLGLLGKPNFKLPHS